MSLLVSEVGITSELVGEGARVGLVAPVPSAVEMPTVIPLADEVNGISEERVTSLVGSTMLLGIPPAEPEAEGAPSVGDTVSSTLDCVGVGKTPVGRGNSPVRDERMLDTMVSEGRTPVGRGSSPVRDERMPDTMVSEGRTPVGRGNSPVRDGRMLDTMVSEGKTPVGRGNSPVRLLRRDSTGSDGRMPVGRPLLGKKPSRLLETAADCVG